MSDKSKSGRELYEELVAAIRKRGAGADLEDWDELSAYEREQWDKKSRGEPEDFQRTN